MMNLDSRKVHASSRPLEKIALIGCAYYIALLVASTVVYGFLAASQQKQAWRRSLSGVHVQWAANLGNSLTTSLVIALLILGVGWGLMKFRKFQRALRDARRRLYDPR